MTLKLVMTCGACPEQYDVFQDGKEVGYLRLRHGHFRAECNGVVVYEATPNGDGLFEYDERDHYLRFAVDAIERHLRGEGPLSPPDVEYEIEQ